MNKCASWTFGLLGFVIFFTVVEVVGRYRLAGSTWPPMSAVLLFMANGQHQALLLRALSSTFFTVIVAYFTGVGAALIAAVIVHLLPSLRRGLDRLAVFVNAVPPVAIAPIFIILTTSYIAGVGLAALYVFFIVYVSMTSAFDHVPQSYCDLFATLGASKRQRLIHLDCRACLPLFINGLKQAVPAAMVGAILAEWFSGQGGIGVLIISAMRNLQIPLLWSAMLLASVTSLVLFALVGLLESKARSTYKI
ncbi:ABC transporter permease subunit [Rhizobium sp. NZLR1]|uniref:ABC transporter permease n=1 Tax=Rhizobium sp. NZLR1 TaxID=2731096 RepID=UPI001A989F58|nr:ABC transporter permease subunit [Rhizobium sp. NZLR1]MBX5204040.1 ABC transporter permease subunit [Rhizobium sp. NZLR1]QSZ25161.1 ABC transporter permease subunit [Rhizobium sp. NZLR1]